MLRLNRRRRVGAVRPVNATGLCRLLENQEVGLP